MLDLPEIPYGGDAAYREMWNRAAADWRERNPYRHVRDLAISRSHNQTTADLQQLLGYLEGFPEAQRAAIAAFKERQAERDAEMARRATNAPPTWRRRIPEDLAPVS